jgi:undecaprenyl phosphate-alpha-L-ara4N flippase subunit ArnE
MGLTAFSIIIAAVALEVLGQIAFKLGASGVVRHAGEQGALLYWRGLLFDGWIQLGIADHVVELFFWIAALNLAPLSLAFPLASLSYCGVAAGGHFLLGEKIGIRGVAAIALITCGAAMVGWPAG